MSFGDSTGRTLIWLRVTCYAATPKTKYTVYSATAAETCCNYRLQQLSTSTTVGHDLKLDLPNVAQAWGLSTLPEHS